MNTIEQGEESATALNAANAAVASPSNLVVSVRTDFGYRTSGNTLGFHLGRALSKPLEDFAVEIRTAQGVVVAPAQLTNARGRCTLATASLSGSYRLRVQPSDAAMISMAKVGPGIADASPSPPDRMYRRVELDVSLQSGRLTAAPTFRWPAGRSAGDKACAGIGNRLEHRWQSHHLPIDLKPVWWRDLNDRQASRKRDEKDIQLIIIHCTSGLKIHPTTSQPMISPTLSTFKPRNQKSIHYVVDVDGHIVSMMRDFNKIGHIGTKPRWHGSVAQPLSIGIEVVHNPSHADYPDAQRDAVLALVRRLVARYGIKGRNVLGHCDVSYSKNMKYPKHKGTYPSSHTKAGQPKPHPKAGQLKGGISRPSDPGKYFKWSVFEALGLGFKISDRALESGDFGGFFDTFPTGSLRWDESNHDRDASGSMPNRYGGRTRSGIPAQGARPPIREMQEELQRLGYWIELTGVYDRLTMYAVMAFQARVFDVHRHAAPGGGRRSVQARRLDAFSARLLKAAQVPS